MQVGEDAGEEGVADFLVEIRRWVGGWVEEEEEDVYVPRRRPWGSRRGQLPGGAGQGRARRGPIFGWAGGWVGGWVDGVDEYLGYNGE